MIPTSEFIYPDTHITTVKVSFEGRTVGSVGLTSYFYISIEINRPIKSNAELMQLVLDNLYCDYEHIWVRNIETDFMVYDCPARAAKGYWRTK